MREWLDEKCTCKCKCGESDVILCAMKNCVRNK